MSHIRSKNTLLEITVRRLVHGMGYRYRLHGRNLPGKPDLVFAGRRKVIFVHGCFWHGHNCKQGKRTPKTNVEFWTEKLSRNKHRDTRTKTALRRLGWKVLVIWQCQCKDVEEIGRRIAAFLEG
jgi:DNA mismatch endonuclease, patch repair protein